jgi:hypothetical protein
MISVHQLMDLPLGQSDMFIQLLNNHRYSPVTAGTMSVKLFLAKKDTDGSAVGRGCWSWRRTAWKQHHGIELASCRQPCEFMPPLGGRLKATQDRGRSQPEERHSLAAEVLRIIHRRKNPVRGVFGKYSRTQHFFVARRLDPCVRHTPPLVGTRLSTSCLMQCD